MTTRFGILFKKYKSTLMVALGLTIIALLYLVVSPWVIAQENPPEPYSERTKEIRRTQTIGAITMELIEVKDAEEGLKILHSYTTDVSSMDLMQVGLPKIEYSDNSYSVVGHTNIVSESSEEAIFTRDSRIPGANENVDVNLGAFIIAATDIRAKVDIPLGQEYNAAVSATNNNSEIPLQIDFSVGDGQFRITSMDLSAQGLSITVVPTNESAKKIVLGTGTGAEAEAILTDDRNSSFTFTGGTVSWDATAHTQAVAAQRFDFYGIPVSAATKMTLTIRGGGGIVGPFVFDNIALVSEDIPPVTPVPPGGVGPGDPIPTPPNANN